MTPTDASELYESQHGGKGRYQGGTFHPEGARPFADFHPIPLPRTVDPQPVADARRMLARGRTVRAMEAMAGEERIALALAPDLSRMDPADIDELARRSGDYQDARRPDLMRPHRINPHGD